jgi:ferritin-like protein
VIKDNGGQRNEDIEKLIKDLGKKWNTFFYYTFI